MNILEILPNASDSTGRDVLEHATNTVIKNKNKHMENENLKTQTIKIIASLVRSQTS